MDKKSRFSKKDRIVILLSLASVLVLGYIMWDSSRKQQQEQEMLQEISEEQSTADAKQKDLTQLAEGLYINEIIRQAGSNCTTDYPGMKFPCRTVRSQ